jgi:hypothetical protein
MKLDLRNIPIFWINSEFATDRREKMIQLFERCGFKNHTRIEAITHENKIIGCALSHSRILGSIDSQKEIIPYFVVMEDDIQETSDLKMEIEIPDDFDAFYLGTSYWANSLDRSKMSLMTRSTYKQFISDSIYRISHMTSLHAVLYKNGEYNKTAGIEILNYLQNPNGNLHCDVVTAELQSKFNVYAVDTPYFYQKDVNNPNNEFWTLKPLKEFE